MFIDVYATMLKASQNKNVLGCRTCRLNCLPGMMFCGLTRAAVPCGRDRRKRNLAQQTAKEHSRLFQLFTRVHYSRQCSVEEALEDPRCKGLYGTRGRRSQNRSSASARATYKMWLIRAVNTGAIEYVLIWM